MNGPNINKYITSPTASNTSVISIPAARYYDC